MKFTDLNLDERILKGIADLGFEQPTPVQEQTFALIAEGRDIQAQSQTGTGKTAAFLISMFQLLLTHPDYQGRKGLVVAPTRELADQIQKDAKILGKYVPLRSACFYGGIGYAAQERALEEGVDIYIGTPGRLLDFRKMGKIPFNQVGVLVIDEADRMFDMGFLPDLREMLSYMSPKEHRLTFLYSATMSPRVGNLAWEYLKENPGEIAVEPEVVTVGAIQQELYHVSHEEKFQLMLGVLQKLQPRNAVIFANTKHQVVKVARRMEVNGYKAEFIMGDLPQIKRLKIVEDIKAGKIQWLVATDVAARGLHIEDLDLVINFDLPVEAENYVHRIGRTARAGKSGKAVSLACDKYVYGLKAIEDYIGQKIPVQWWEGELPADKSAGMRISGDIDDAVPQRGRDRDRDRGRDGRGERREGFGRRDGAKGTVRTETRDDRDLRNRRRQPHNLVSEATGASALDKPAGPPRGEGRQDGRRRSQERVENLPNRARPKGTPVAAKGPKNPSSAIPADNPHGDRGRDRNRGRGRDRAGSKDRIEYYKQKYGENFKAPAGSSGAAPKKPSLWDRILGLFGVKKAP